MMLEIKQKIIIIFFGISVIACKNTNLKKNDSHKLTSNLQTYTDQNSIRISDSLVDIEVYKHGTDSIHLKYTCKKKKHIEDLYFRYFNYSEVIFPDTSIVVFKKNRIKKLNYYLLTDDVLVLPLIGMNDFLSIYVINLRSKEVIGNDVRTYLDFVWINDEEKTLMISDSPEFINYSIYRYNLKKIRINSDKIDLIKSNFHDIKFSEKNNYDVNYKIANQFLRD